MIIVDDRLSLEALAGRLGLLAGRSPVATTWSFHFRLLRALADDTRMGRLAGARPAGLFDAAASPPAGRLLVLDPRELTTVAVAVAVRHRLNLLAAELVAAAKVHSATVALSPGNVGREWPSVFAAEGIDFRVQG